MSQHMLLTEYYKLKVTFLQIISSWKSYKNHNFFCYKFM